VRENKLLVCRKGTLNSSIDAIHYVFHGAIRLTVRPCWHVTHLSALYNIVKSIINGCVQLNYFVFFAI